MDKNIYGKLQPQQYHGTYQPYRCTRKNGSKPGYALLADLQSTIQQTNKLNSGVNGGYGSINGGVRSRLASAGSPVALAPEYATVRSHKIERSTSNPAVRQELSPTQPRNEFKSSKMTSSLNNNLSELDTLLQDLSNSRYADKKLVNGDSYSIPTKTVNIPTRPSVDSLLDELDTSLSSKSNNGQLISKMMMEETTTTTTRTVCPTASSATRELDDLMASLSDFKVSSPVRASYATESADSAAPRLDCMLGSLTAEMNRQGVNTTQKGCCTACDKAIVGQVITALGKTWHPEHFTCNHCSQELGTRNFFEREGRPYCEPDYHNLFSPRCAYCNGPILDKCVTALEKTWHTEHFFCAQCGKQFGEEGFHEREGRPYCKDDYFDMFAPKCGGCTRPIMENYVSALSTQWHSSCFVCRDCKQPVTGKSFYAIEGKPACAKCVGVDEED
ncbi:paxillin isoform X5 [Acyrthosiphon pisum]|uniref:LIM zinc-binding domain-containing protein n=1 Tax=Acyrthosiphon pisum TaxID=7029 RepID=A0A8R2F7N6_ACYPI|nr:paxillin isoform X5 [Acyrthosiphon pisum]|eukprot:XP_008182343.1 PREDICTED: paxillin-like isoform X4 [Acyrthosiphon pisum]